MSNVPFFYNYQNMVTSQINPSTMHVTNTGLSIFFQKYLLQKAMSVFKWNIPKNWSKDYFLYTLYCQGYIAVFNTNKYGVIPQHNGLQGYDIFYRPSHATIYNPLFDKMYTLRIGMQCTLFKLQPDYSGIMDLVTYYADLMALTSETMGVNIVNSKLSYVLTAESNTIAQSLKKLFDSVASGEPCVVQDKQMLNIDGTPKWAAFSQNVGQNYIADKLLEELNRIEDRFNTEVGIPNANTYKKERLITAEVDANKEEVHSKCSIWLEQLQESCKQAREMFDIEISVDWRNKPIQMEREDMKNGES